MCPPHVQYVVSSLFADTEENSNAECGINLLQIGLTFTSDWQMACELGQFHVSANISTTVDRGSSPVTSRSTLTPASEDDTILACRA